ncbi:MAG: cellulase family glycosylhydrolase [Candidatus Krumholzibacteriota bacterium]|nr:cellulase family glycosylhydrolase [Candidatus Krumholzibacteriota bacterium]
MRRIPITLLGLALLAAPAGSSTAAGTRATIELVADGDVTTWPDTPYRGRDIAANSYSRWFQDSVIYEQSSVTVSYTAAGSGTFTGHLSAADLKPNFAYQIKLVGKPAGLWGAAGDDATNEILGYAGRWWRHQPNPGNASDADYEAHHDDPDYIYEGYLLFDFILTDRYGAAERDLLLDSSYHVLWWEHQRTPGPCDSPVRWQTVSGGPGEPTHAYAEELAPVDVGVYAEIERLCTGETTLPAGSYKCRFVLTEESFHQTGESADPDWTSVAGLRFWRDEGPLRFAGMNCYYLMVFAANPALRPYVDEVLAEAAAMGLTVARTWAFSDGGDDALQVSPGVYDEAVFVGLDYVLNRADSLGLQLVLPFVNNWDDYGGMNQYVAWSPTASAHDDFYTDGACRQWYQDHVEAVLDRVNTFNGRRYADDPTILAWELANEPRCTSDPSGDTLQAWIETMAAWVKSLDDRHLLTTGSIGYYGPSGPDHNPRPAFGSRGVDFIRNHQVAAIDFACFHAWPHHWGLSYQESMDWVGDHVDDAATLLGKPVILEEFGIPRAWSLPTRDLYFEDWYGIVRQKAAAGLPAAASAFWILYHDAYPDYDDLGVYHPADASTVAIIESAAVDMARLSAPYGAQGQWACAMVGDELSFTLGGGDTEPPAAVTAIAAGPDHERIHVSWTNPSDPDLDRLEVWRGLWCDSTDASAYPHYADPGEVPPRPADHDALGASGAWSLAGTVAAPAQVFTDSIVPRGVYYYEVLAADTADNWSPPAAANARATNYRLGDVSDGVYGAYDGLVSTADVTAMGSGYGLHSGETGFKDEVDIAPTDDGSGSGVPVPDASVDFEDLMIFALNFAAGGPLPPAAGRTDPVARLRWSPADGGGYSLVLLEPCAGLKGLSLNLDGPASDVAVARGALLDRQDASCFLRHRAGEAPTVDLAVLGAGRDLVGAGELFRVTNHGTATAPPRIAARDLDNQPVACELLAEESQAAAAGCRLRQNHPNPFNPRTWIRFRLDDARDLRLVVYACDGRYVAQLASGRLPAGEHVVAWDGCDDRGRPQGSGVYLCRVEAGDFTETRKMLLLR